MGVEALTLLVLGLLGATLGSFLNVLLFRYQSGRSVVAGRSRCMHCGHTLGFFDLFPIFSFLALRGRCRYCKSRVSVQYPLVEAAGAAIVCGTYLVEPDPVRFVLAALFWFVLLFIFVYDWRHKIIPWGGLLLVILLGFVLGLGADHWGGLWGGLLLAAPLALLSLISGGRWMGWGDGLLELGLGWYLGLTAGLTAFVFAFWAGAVIGIVLILRAKGYTMKSEVPFAPFLILGAALAAFLHVDIFQTLPALFH